MLCAAWVRACCFLGDTIAAKVLFVDNFWTVTCAVTVCGPRGLCDNNSFYWVPKCFLTSLLLCVVPCKMKQTMPPKVIQFVLRHRALDEPLRARVSRLHRKMSIRAIAALLNLQPSSVHSLLARPCELQRDIRKRLVPSIVFKLARVKGHGRKKRVTARRVVTTLPKPCSLRTVRRVMKGMQLDTKRKRKRMKNDPLSQEQEAAMNRCRHYQGW